ncbi:glycosyltransferase family 1 protein [Bifidobacterium sp. ESL0732]|uniref:glycosyltransferase family 1 protein n=1 Tax=Bifidobacterium sp. ESL0732 TaxID=2983222 RepID=UPI0023F90EE7|nr:glycosyltransferase family 1 protein [Bifidobacterium sp. ESL0732]WEV64327.1 glycosyltransferase family 1 protein [Bifidobacterium sp. ESL0732]
MVDDSPIRILVVSGPLVRGGAETVTMNYYRHFDRDKVQFDFLVPDNGECGAYESEIKELGGIIYKTPPMHDFFHYIFGLRKFFREHKNYKIIHSNIDELSYLPLRVAKQMGIPVRIAHAHTSRTTGKYSLLLNYFRRKLPKYATHYFACSEVAGRWLFGDKAEDDGKVAIIKNSIDLNDYAFSESRRRTERKRLGIRQSEFVVGTVGRLTKVKNQGFLLKIFAEIVKMCPDSLLLIVGDGELREDLQEKSVQLGIQSKVRFTGSVPDDWDYMQAMDAFVFPSLFEGLGMALIEAEVAGLPCFTSDQVPLEADITQEVSFIPINSSPMYWAEQIMMFPKHNRVDHVSDAKAAGMDIVTEAAKLQNFYLTEWEKI